MWGVRVFGMGVAAMVLVGCAGGRTRHDLARLQSQVGLLDERVGQLERSTMAAAPLASSSGGSAEWAPTASEPMPSAKSLPAPHKLSMKSTTTKPSTREMQ